MLRLGGMYGPDVTFLGVERCDLAQPSTFEYRLRQRGGGVPQTCGAGEKARESVTFEPSCARQRNVGKIGGLGHANPRIRGD